LFSEINNNTLYLIDMFIVKQQQSLHDASSQFQKHV